MTKRCRKCGYLKPLTEFGKHPARRDGHVSQCKKCVAERQRVSRQQPDVRERHNADNRRWYAATQLRRLVLQPGRAARITVMHHDGSTSEVQIDVHGAVSCNPRRTNDQASQ